ncbi:YdeI family protein [Roseivirga sp. E12]|uniref:YdeI/OmpD-associated family protein n=1 Tax=Roseivirga sp. E12 TaxID=2819237 RepID=UPI001ABCE804|nr:YdeI/OmpD-associated family protein [Roseivirga sp. E12]MBO3697176.1 YdeI/OmpD-associated family protein [Roseivirga sp. E12]
MEKKNIEEYFSNDSPHPKSMRFLRSIIMSFPFEETVKWAFPVYTINGKNVVGLGGFKAYAGIWFFQGVFLEDASQKLINAQEGKTHGMRQWRFMSLEEIEDNEDLIRLYVQEAIDNHLAGKEFKPQKKASKPLVIPEELQEALDSIEGLKESFEAFSLSNKRDFAEYIANAKRAETKLSRLEKITPMISRGEGLNDKYKR